MAADQYGIDLGQVYGLKFAKDANTRAMYDFERKKKDDTRKDVVDETAKQAIDPTTGQYSPELHFAALEKAGFPQEAVVLRRQQLETLTSSIAAFEKAIPYATEQNWGEVRGILQKGGIAPNLIPEKPDPQWLTETKARLGATLAKYGPMEKVADGPGGAAIYGQREATTGKLENVKEITPPRPYAPGWGAGRTPAAVATKQAFAEALGMDLGSYLRWERDAKRKSPDEVYADLVPRFFAATQGDKDLAYQMADEMVASIFGSTSIRRPPTAGAPAQNNDPLGLRAPPRQ